MIVNRACWRESSGVFAVKTAAGLAANDVFARRERGPRQLGALVAQNDLGHGDVHGAEKCPAFRAKPRQELDAPRAEKSACRRAGFVEAGPLQNL